MKDKQLEQRLALLKKSYGRIETKLNPEDVFKQIAIEEEEVTQPNDIQVESLSTPIKRPLKWKKPTIWVVSITGVLLVGTFVITTILQDEQQIQTEMPNQETTVTYEEGVANFTEIYQTKREEVREELSLTEEQFATLSFVQSADSNFDFFTTEGRYDDPSYFMTARERSLTDLLTPWRAIEQIETYADPLSIDEAYAVYASFSNSASSLIDFYNNELQPYIPILEKESDKDKWPWEVLELITNARDQYIKLEMNQDEIRFVVDLFNSSITPDYVSKLPNDIVGLFEYLKTGFLLHADELRYDRVETAYSLMLIEQTLLGDLYSDTPDFEVLKGVYEMTWLALLRGTDKYPIRNAQGQLDSEYLAFLKEAADGEYGESISTIASTVFKELKLAGQSNTLEVITEEDIWMGVLQNRGEIRDYVGNSEVTTIPFDESTTKGIYEYYETTKDEEMLNDLQPINIVSLYLYATSYGDIATAQSLVDPNSLGEMASLPQFESMELFKNLHTFNNDVTTVTVTIKEEYRPTFGEEWHFKMSVYHDEEGHNYYRIAAVTK